MKHKILSHKKIIIIIIIIIIKQRESSVHMKKRSTLSKYVVLH